MLLILVALAAIGLAAFTYLGLERLGSRGLVPMACRAVAWAALGVLLVNTSCPGALVQEPPLVLLDASLSLGGAQGRWAEAKALADSLGEVRRFGARGAEADSGAVFGRSALAPALIAAAATGRPVTIVTDGEIDDLPDAPRDLAARAGVRLLPRRAGQDDALVAVEAPARAVQGDTVTVLVDLRRTGSADAAGAVANATTGVESPATSERTVQTPAASVARRAGADSVTVVVEQGATVLARRRVALRDGAGRAALAIPTAGLAPGERLLRIRRDGAPDVEPDTDVRLHRLDLAETPGAVLLAAPGDWDARFLYRTVRDVANLPVRGFIQLEPDRWRDMRDLRPVPDAEVRRAAARADLLLLKGRAVTFAKGSAARGVLEWSSGENGESLVPGDWYLTAAGASPVAGALAGAPIDSFAPATAITPIQPPADAWIGLTAQEGRRGAARPVVVGRVDGRVRRVTVAAEGLFRWGFRGGSSEQAYRSLVGATVAWLLGGADSAGGVARPLRSTVQRGQPITFEWRAAGRPVPTAIGWSGAGTTRRDTLRFDGAGRASLWLPPGEWRYTLAAGGSGLVAVERFSDELLPRPVVLTEQPPSATLTPRRTAARDRLWLFGLALLALTGEWFARRRLGLR